MKDQSNGDDKNCPTSSGSSSATDPQMPKLMPKWPTTPKPVILNFYPMNFRNNYSLLNS
jgi:hypothetical protein